MREVLLYLRMDLRGVLRGRGTRAGFVLALGALALALALAPGANALASTWFAWVIGTVAVLLAAGGASLLPADRLEGRADWLATLRPRKGTRRAGALLTGVVLALGGAVALALLVGTLAPALGLAPPVRESRDLTPKRAVTFRDASAAGAPRRVSVKLGEPLAVRGTLVVETRPAGWIPGMGTPEPLTVAYTAGDEVGSLEVPWRARLEVPVPPDAREVHLDLVKGEHDLRVVKAWFLGAPCAAWSSWLWVGLVLGLFGAALAPLAVTFSRFTSAPTAAAATLVVVLVAAMRGVLPDLEGLPAPGPLEHVARAILQGAVAIAPDLSGLAVVAEPAAGRALGPKALAALGPLLPHALGWTALLLLPALGADPREEE